MLAATARGLRALSSAAAAAPAAAAGAAGAAAPAINYAAAGAAAFQFSGALCRALSPDFAAAALRSDASVSIDAELAKRQHAAYVAALQQVVGAVEVLPAAEGAPDSCFIEDTAAATRARFANAAAKASPEARIGAGDGRKRGAVPLHLKSVASMVGPDTVAVADTPLGRALAFWLQDETGVPKAQRVGGKRLSFVLVPAGVEGRSAAAANAVYANGQLLIRAAGEAPEGVEELRDYASVAGIPVTEVAVSELAKADGALTCCSLLLR